MDADFDRSDPAVQTKPASDAPAERLVALDAFRGAAMLIMVSGGLGFPQVAQQFPDSAFWRLLAREVDHSAWTGCTLWDLVQPAFMFTVGAVLPWSIARRRARGQSFGAMFGHALWRSLALVLLGVFLTSMWGARTRWEFSNVLAQIGLGYVFLFLLGLARPRTCWLAALGILFADWLAFALTPLPPADYDWTRVGLAEDWQHPTGFAAHWDWYFNLAARFSRWFLNLFPREEPFVVNPGGYATLNFIPSLATMIFGLLAGHLLRSELPLAQKLKRLVLGGLAGVVIGKSIELAGLCPIVKRLWTPSWAIYSGGLVALLFAAFVAVIEGRGWRRWAFPLVVAGLNPIALYCIWQTLGGFIMDNLRIHLGRQAFEIFGAPGAPVLERVSLLVVFWLMLLWMYRRKIFLRI